MKKTIAVLAVTATALLAAEMPASFSHAADLDSAYQAVLNQLKKDGAEIESASKDAGIKTAVAVSGHYRRPVLTWKSRLSRTVHRRRQCG